MLPNDTFEFFTKQIFNFKKRIEINSDVKYIVCAHVRRVKPDGPLQRREGSDEMRE